MNGEERSQNRASVDLKEIHRRLEAARTKNEAGFMPDPEEQRRILRARARALAKEPASEETELKFDVLEFLLASERYGIETSFVREVYPLKDLTPVPCTPAHVLGIVNVRGQILSVIDLKKFFDLPEKGLGELNKVIILKSDAMEFGVLADAILGVRSLPRQGLQPSLPTLTGIREEYLLGISDDHAVILDAGTMLSDGKIIVNEEVA